MRRNLTYRFGVAFLIAVIGLPGTILAKTVDELREELNEKRSNLKQVEENIQKFKERVQLKRQEARTLESQIDIMNDTIEELELTIDRTVAEVEETTAAIATVGEDITQKEQEMDQQKALLAEYIRSLHAVDQQSTVAIFLKYDTFSEAITEASTFTELHDRAHQTFLAVQQLHEELSAKKRDLEDYKQTVEALQRRHEQQQQTLEAQRVSKSRILELTNAQEKQYQSLLKQSQQAHQQAQAEISQLDTKIREELSKQGLGKLPSVGVFNWPIEPIFGVSCEFHCAGYPFAYLIGPHSGMDIPANVGTPITAPADGYVARLHDAGGPGYSYILLLHGDNVSSVYGHVSGFGAVREGELVKRGTVIGYTGGGAGMRGAGLSTGPHLHFEVRLNNVPINPRNYL